jgi:uncharacterized membrane protein HdeD (DUF308 family)
VGHRAVGSIKLVIIKEIKMKLSAPKNVTWWIAVFLGLIGILASVVSIPFLSDNSFWIVALAFILLALATLLKGL